MGTHRQAHALRNRLNDPENSGSHPKESLNVPPKLFRASAGEHISSNEKILRQSPAGLAVGLIRQLNNKQGQVSHETFGSDGPLWSLSYEFWYYILFLLELFAVRSKTPVRTRVICLVFFAGIAYQIGPQILSSFPIWLLVTVLALMSVAKLSNKARLLAVVLYVPLFFWIGRTRHLPEFSRDYLLAAATLAILWVILSASSPCVPSLGEGFSRGLSSFSFTLYVVHTPLCVLLAALLTGDTRWVPTPIHLLTGLIVLVLLLGYAYGVARLTEFQTVRVHRWLEPRLCASEQPTNQPSSQVGLGRIKISPCARHLDHSAQILSSVSACSVPLCGLGTVLCDGAEAKPDKRTNSVLA